MSGVIVVTRTEPGALVQAEALRAAGFESRVCPLLSVQCCEAPRLSVGTPDIVFFMSVHAVRCGLGHVRNSLDAARCFAVGRATADALRAEGIESRVPETGESTEDLLALPELREVSDANIVIVRGEGGREKLAEELEARAAQVECLDVYRRIRNRQGMMDLQDAFRDALQDVDTVVIGSGDGVRALADLVAMDGRGELNLIVPSKRVADVALELGFATLSISDGASDEAVISCLKSRDQRG